MYGLVTVLTGVLNVKRVKLLDGPQAGDYIWVEDDATHCMGYFITGDVARFDSFDRIVNDLFKFPFGGFGPRVVFFDPGRRSGKTTWARSKATRGGYTVIVPPSQRTASTMSPGDFFRSALSREHHVIIVDEPRICQVTSRDIIMSGARPLNTLIMLGEPYEAS